MLQSLGGTPGYWAPEAIMRKPHAFTCDIWSFGVVMYRFLVGTVNKMQIQQIPKQTKSRTNTKTKTIQ